MALSLSLSNPALVLSPSPLLSANPCIPFLSTPHLMQSSCPQILNSICQASSALGFAGREAAVVHYVAGGCTGMGTLGHGVIVNGTELWWAALIMVGST